MPDQPTLAFQVSDISLTLAFLTEKLGFTLAESRPDEDVAYIIDSDGDMLLLTGPTAQNVTSYLDERHFILNPGESMDFGCVDLEARQAELLARGVLNIQRTQNRLGDSALCVQILDNYLFRFVASAVLSFEELLNLYARSMDELDEALAGLDEKQLDLSFYEGGWSIRQIVHHIADADILFGQPMKVALSSSGTKLERFPAVGNERITTEPEYQKRSVSTSVALFRAFHTHIIDIVKYVPDAEERYIEQTDGSRRTFGQLLRLINRHTGDHLDEIRVIRDKYGL